MGRYWLTPDTMPAEQYYAVCDRLSDAKVEYVRAINARDLATRVKWENCKQTPRSSDAFALRKAMFDSQVRVDEIEIIGREFYTVKEIIDLRAAADLGEHRYEIAGRKYRAAETKRRLQERADANANVVRVVYRRKSQEVHL
jgi:hypothetical protein